MKGEINKDFFCAADFYINDPTTDKQCQGRQVCSESCKRYHRKYPTPEQFREEHGFEYPDRWAVYVNTEDGPNRWYDVSSYYHYKSLLDTLRERKALQYVQHKIYAVCACTPWGEPPVNWWPEWKN